MQGEGLAVNVIIRHSGHANMYRMYCMSRAHGCAGATSEHDPESRSNNLGLSDKYSLGFRIMAAPFPE